MKKIVSILGSTGSIGLTTLKILKKNKNLYEYNIFSANKNFKLICNQINNFKPKVFLINNKNVAIKVKNKFKNKKIKVLSFKDFENYKFKKSDILISAIPGIAGLFPTLQIIDKTKRLLIANKESIICGWNLINNLAKKNKTKITLIDSEHYSISQLIENVKKNEIKKIYLTASGGPFLDHKISKLKNVKVSDALKHPKWQMGKKISIDSATLMNKILELVEAQKFFNIPKEKLDIIIHPESLVHAILILNNGLVKFIYHKTSMIIPIANALIEKKLNIDKYISEEKNKISNLSFKKVDKSNFPIIQIKDKMFKYPSTPIIINAANEVLVDHFLRKKIAFNSIYRFIMNIMKDRNFKKYAIKGTKNLDQIFLIDNWARNTIKKMIEKND